MCGIDGIFLHGKESAAKRHEAERLVVRALARIRHRGEPQYQCETATGDTWVMGANRLAIISSAEGAQPVQSSDGRVSLVFNGEIYNYRSVASEIGVDEERI